MKKLVVLTLILVVLLGLALATRPDRASLERRVTRMENPDASDLTARATSALLHIQADLTLEYEDHNLWAMGEVAQGSKRLRYLGVFGIWIPLGEG